MGIIRSLPPLGHVFITNITLVKWQTYHEMLAGTGDSRTTLTHLTGANVLSLNLGQQFVGRSPINSHCLSSRI